MIEVKTVYQVAFNYDDQAGADGELAQLLNDGWRIVNITSVGQLAEYDYVRYVTLTRGELDDKPYIPF